MRDDPSFGEVCDYFHSQSGTSHRCLLYYQPSIFLASPFGINHHITNIIISITSDIFPKNCNGIIANPIIGNVNTWIIYCTNSPNEKDMYILLYPSPRTPSRVIVCFFYIQSLSASSSFFTSVSLRTVKAGIKLSRISRINSSISSSLYI